MISILRALITLPMAACLLWLVLANSVYNANANSASSMITLIWSPIHNPLTISLASLILAMTAIGFVWGGLMVGINSLKHYSEKQQQRKTIRQLQKDLQIANQNALNLNASKVAMAETPNINITKSNTSIIMQRVLGR